MVATHIVKCLTHGYPMPDNTLDNVSAPTNVGNTGTGIFSNLFIRVLSNLQNKIQNYLLRGRSLNNPHQRLVS